MLKHKIIFCLMLLFACVAHGDILDYSEPLIELQDENGNKIDVPNSRSTGSLIEKAVNQGSGTYFGEYKGKVRVIVDLPETTTEPEPPILTDADCAPLIANGTGDACIAPPEPEPEPDCEAPRQWLPSDEQGEPDYCGCQTGYNYIEATNECEPLDMGHNHDGLPVVDTSKNISPATGQSIINIGDQLSWYSPDNKAGTNEGDFRLNCNVSHMANDDPIVYPNQQGAAHHHTFFGNTDMYFDADVSKADEYGNSTCNGGIANRSGYWVPSMIDTATNTPLNPDGIGVYYKTQRADAVTVPPKGLRIIAKGFTETDFMCNEDYGGRGINQIIPCGQGSQLRYGVNFPNCWDGVNLDSPDHMSHMAYVVWSDACPASHPVRIPNITINVFYNVDTPAGTTNWRLASDPDGAIAGSTIHADWVNGWNEQVLTDIVNNCLKGEQDCHSDLIGDGRQLY